MVTASEAKVLELEMMVQNLMLVVILIGVLICLVTGVQVYKLCRRATKTKREEEED